MICRHDQNLTARIAALVTEKYPVAWSAEEIALTLGTSRRTVSRCIGDLVSAGMVEKHYTAYRLRTALVTQLYGGEWYLRQENEKHKLILDKEKKNGRPHRITKS